MRSVPVAVLVLAAAVPRPVAGGLPELARAGRWQAIVSLARARSGKLPLQPDEALVVAAAARRLGERELLADALAEAARDQGGVGDVARVELARLVGPTQPERAAELVQPVLAAGATDELREAALARVEEVAAGLDESRRAELLRAGARLPTAQRRRLELALALPDDPASLRRLRRLLAADSGDGPALEAASRLLAAGGLDERTRWPAAEALYRHALYRSAAPLLDALVARPVATVPRWKVAFLRGRCAFRLGEWEAAATWYRRALAHCRRRSDRAELEVHLARARELGGDIKGALVAAQRARRARDSDDRRLFVLRLLLRLGRRDEAETAVAGVHHRDARDRGRLLLVLEDLKHGRAAAARRGLAAISGPDWGGPARVLAAGLALGADEPGEALSLLEAAADGLEGFWSTRARAVAAALPAPLLAAWRARLAAEVAAADPRQAAAVVARWATLEPDPGQLPPLPASPAPAPAPTFPPGLARQLWQLGLDEEAARWDPDGFPADEGALWSAARLHELGQPRRAIRLAEGVRARRWPGLPGPALPPAVQRALYPLPPPWRAALRGLAAERGVPWPLLAGLVREESRWDANALSRVGARGLTQLMPVTAVQLAAGLGQPAPAPEDLFSPRIALHLGSIELGRLLADFHGRWAPAVAAYNAGEAQARLWLDECGAGCTDERFLLTVSFRATRGYTAEVLTSADMYALVQPEEGSEPGPVTERSGSPPGARAPEPASSRSPG